MQKLLAKIAKGEELTGGEITFLGWEAFDEWCQEMAFDDEDEVDWPARTEVYSQACDKGWRPSWERQP